FESILLPCPGHLLDRVEDDSHLRKRLWNHEAVPAPELPESRIDNVHRHKQGVADLGQLHQTGMNMIPGPTRSIRRHANDITLAQGAFHLHQRRSSAAGARTPNSANTEPANEGGDQLSIFAGAGERCSTTSGKTAFEDMRHDKETIMPECQQDRVLRALPQHRVGIDNPKAQSGEQEPGDSRARGRDQLGFAQLGHSPSAHRKAPGFGNSSWSSILETTVSATSSSVVGRL